MILLKHWTNGFTLIEVLVALSLISIAVLSVLGVFGTIGLTSERARMKERVAYEIDEFLIMTRVTSAWTNWNEGRWVTNYQGVLFEIEFQRELEGLWRVNVKGKYEMGKRTNIYEVFTLFSRMYEKAF